MAKKSLKMVFYVIIMMMNNKTRYSPRKKHYEENRASAESLPISSKRWGKKAKQYHEDNKTRDRYIKLSNQEKTKRESKEEHGIRIFLENNTERNTKKKSRIFSGVWNNKKYAKMRWVENGFMLFLTLGANLCVFRGFWGVGASAETLEVFGVLEVWIGNSHVCMQC